MNITDFCTLRTGLQRNADPACETALSAFARTLEEALTSTGLFHSVEVGHTDDADRLIIAMVGFAPELDPAQLSHALAELWVGKIAHRFWSAHATLIGRGHVELQAASRESSEGEYVTVHLVGQAATIPVQRPVPLDEQTSRSAVFPAQRAGASGREWLAGPALGGA